MKPIRVILASCFLVVIFLLAVAPVVAGMATEPQPPMANLPNMESSNYCLSCHSAGDERLKGATAWKGDIEREVVNPCPAAATVHQELYYTERLMLAVDRARTNLPAWADASKLEARITASQQTYSRLLDAPVTSLDAFITEASILRYSFGKIYAQINQIIGAVKLQWVLIFAALVTLVVLLSLAWGLRNTQKAIRKTSGVSSIQKTNQKRSSNFLVKALFILVLVFVVFALPIFRGAAQEVTSTTEEEQEIQAILDMADRSATTADRELARTWMLARVGAIWSASNSSKGHEILDEAFAAADEAQMNASALWGEALAAQEAGAGNAAKQDTAVLVSSNLDAMQSRAWGLRLIAEEWLSVDPQISIETLDAALGVANGASGIYRDLDLRGIAVTWARLDLIKGMQVAVKIKDPAIRSWAFREMSEVSGDDSVLEYAGEAARKVSDPVQRARLLREIALQSGEDAYFDEAIQALDGVDGVALAYALSDLAAVSGDVGLAEQIEAAYPAARAAAFYRLGQFDAAWDAAQEISDPYERARAQATIAGEWGSSEAADKIEVPVLRDLAMRNVSIKNRDMSLAENIPSAYYRIQALTALGEYEAAWQSAKDLKDGYPLVDLAIAWAVGDPPAALEVVEAMSREVDKARALIVIAAATDDQEVFERALGMTLAARVSGDSLSPAEMSLELAKAFIGIDLSKVDEALIQAHEAAQRIMIKYR